MNEQLASQFDSIELQRTRLCAIFSWFTESQFDWKPTPSSWSINQIIEHLVLIDEIIVRPVGPNARKAEPLAFKVVPRNWRFRLIIDAMDKEVRLPLPTPLVDPNGNEKMSVLIQRWEAARKQIREDLIHLKPGERVYFHPALGLLTPQQILELLYAHTAYHLRQIDAIKADKRLPD